MPITIQSGTPYMVRNDGEIFECGKIHPYILSAKGTPLIESLYNSESKILQNGGTLIEAFGDFGPLHNINKFMGHKYSYMVRHFCKKDKTRVKYKEFKVLNFLEDQL